MARCIICDIEAAKLTATEAYAVGYTHAMLVVRTTRDIELCEQHMSDAFRAEAGNSARRKIAEIIPNRRPS